MYITRLASNEVFSLSNKIHRKVGRAKDLSAVEDKPNEVIRVTSHFHGLVRVCSVTDRGDFEHLLQIQQ